jgi:hypothetical protein
LRARRANRLPGVHESLLAKLVGYDASQGEAQETAVAAAWARRQGLRPGGLGKQGLSASWEAVAPSGEAKRARR